MGKITGISWTDHTWNPWWGCSKISPGCAHCYAETFAKRTGHDIWGPNSKRRTFGVKHWNEPHLWAIKAMRRERVFCGSMCDVFEDHPTANAEREKLWKTIRSTPGLDWQLLTKRPENIKKFLPPDWGDGWDNVWLGTSVEDQKRAEERIPILMLVPSIRRFLSVEPLLEDVDLGLVENGAESPDEESWAKPTERGCLIHWVIVGGESGDKRRDCGVEAIVTVANQCIAAEVPVFVKQDCALRPGQQGRIPGIFWALKQFPC